MSLTSRGLGLLAQLWTGGNVGEHALLTAAAESAGGGMCGCAGVGDGERREDDGEGEVRRLTRVRPMRCSLSARNRFMLFSMLLPSDVFARAHPSSKYLPRPRALSAHSWGVHPPAQLV